MVNMGRENTWSTSRGSGHPLDRLDGRPFAGAILEIMLGPKNRFGACYFRIMLRDGAREASQPLLLALHHSGPYPSHNWIETISLNRELHFSERESYLSQTDLEDLLRYLSDLLPPGGHMMVEYDGEMWEESRLSLEYGILPVVTPLGYMLFRAGCGVAFKDWHFAEGGWEGPRKLQGYKALNSEHHRTRTEEMKAELRSFLSKGRSHSSPLLWEAARKRAELVLSLLSTSIS